MSRQSSALERARAEYRPRTPEILSAGIEHLGFEEDEATTAVRDHESIRQSFPRIRHSGAHRESVLLRKPLNGLDNARINIHYASGEPA